MCETFWWQPFSSQKCVSTFEESKVHFYLCLVKGSNASLEDRSTPLSSKNTKGGNPSLAIER